MKYESGYFVTIFYSGTYHIYDQTYSFEKNTVSRLGEKVQGQNELRHDFDAVFDDSSLQDNENPNHVLTPYEKQIVFFERNVRPLIDRALAQGINLTLVTYGQTGAGKTWCIDGDGGVRSKPRPFRISARRLSTRNQFS